MKCSTDFPQFLRNTRVKLSKTASWKKFPDFWKKAKVVAFSKKSYEASPENYRPISLLYSTSKTFEKLLYIRKVHVFGKINCLHRSNLNVDKKGFCVCAFITVTDNMREKMPEKQLDKRVSLISGKPWTPEIIQYC